MAWVLLFVVGTGFVCFFVVWIINRAALKTALKEVEKLQSAEPELQKKFDQMFMLGRDRIKAEFDEAKKRSDGLALVARGKLDEAKDHAGLIVQDALKKASEVAIEAAKLELEADVYQQTVIAMKNILDGYGDEYLLPTASLLDDLAEEYSYKDAGQQLKKARKQIKAMIKNGEAASCEYVELNRRQGAEGFVIDAFNGKVDSILAKVKHDNAGKLSQAIFDAFIQVNFGGKAFRNARVTNEYRDARLEELRWAAIAHELRVQEREEQRRIREQIREEDKARREYEKAMREAEKEEELIKKAMEKAQRQAAEASAETRAKFEAQLAELESKLHEAEEKNQRAVSMAQMTKRGHVYVISNVGSFGDNIYKIGLTRRLEPYDRVKELGDASVPFSFDVHAMIMSDDAPGLEKRLHKHFIMNQVNKVNHRKEFFRAPLAEIRSELEAIGVEVKWTMASEAADYRETLVIEKMINEDPATKEAWESRQLKLDPTDYITQAEAIER